MRCQILLCIMALTACSLISVGVGDDWLEGGYVGSSRRSDDPGLAGMLKWLDQPVPSYPWYTAGGSFYSQRYTEATFWPFREYYTTTGSTASSGIISDPARFNIAQKMPLRIYYGTGQGLSYSQYAATMPTKTNDLWIQGATDWSQYVVIPQGTWLQLVAYAPVEGPAGFYEMIHADTTSSKYKTYRFYQGYNTMTFKADQLGRHMLYFVVNNQPSNVIVVDVFAMAPPGSMPLSSAAS